MKLLLLFLFCYFVYRYGRYIFNSFKNNTSPQQPKQTVFQNNTSSANSNTTKKNDGDEGEYVEFEEVKE